MTKQKGGVNLLIAHPPKCLRTYNQLSVNVCQRKGQTQANLQGAQEGGFVHPLRTNALSLHYAYENVVPILQIFNMYACHTQDVHCHK